MKRYLNVLSVPAIVFFLIVSQTAFAAAYKYADKNGAVHYTDNPASIPEEYRADVVSIKDLPESVVKKTPTAFEKVISNIKSHITSTNAAAILIAVPAIWLITKISSRLWLKNKRKLRLVFKKNKAVVSKTHSGQLCSGIEQCLYSDAIQKVQRISNDNFGKISHFEQRFCRYQHRFSGQNHFDNKLTVEKYEKYTAKNSLCYHPAEIALGTAWLCYKCGSSVSSERERHC